MENQNLKRKSKKHNHDVQEKCHRAIQKVMEQNVIVE
jgi:hypothetical protein